MQKKYLMIPGPTPIPPEVTLAMSRPMIGHRSGDFAKLHERVVAKLKQVFKTQNDIFILTNSGTGGMEMAVANVVNPGDEVLALSTGNFGERFAKIAKEYGAKVDMVDFGWGNAVDLAVVEEKLRQNPNYKAVLATHNETSTGVKNDIAGIAALTKNHRAVLIVDAVSSLGGMEFDTDGWGVDVVVTGSQKALMLPPGLAFISFSQKALEAAQDNKNPKFYFSLPAAKKALAEWNTAYTPAVSLFFGLEAALDLILEEGLDKVIKRHKLLAKACREGVKALGLKLFPAEENASDTVTAVAGDDRYDPEQLRKVLRTKYGVTFAGGQKDLKGKIFRIGHMGYVDKLDIIVAIGALEMALKEIGYPVELGAGVKKAMEVITGGEA
ncbi:MULTISPECIES: pyridoxal-phosphate-dependent aminotransferase family protein [Carboxydothermus]|uniref:Soluble hydrogenase, 42 kDa subunit n=2 Tax=Carboxydothermus TaxID=129957 RepID=Q3A8Q3_CARHZ|nr:MULTISPECIES: alanine--glyoxylate aminotransferase family protein [Carboxydothermus]ABB15912.1 soluble hydrogenase, 42 kDa subunit [Carboxydothermus hydrogenoformans Z-2901]NYE57609.1 aspartate aminotransferase-like enzyme [Carboxydothermus ferrireducens DSM 11255]